MPFWGVGHQLFWRDPCDTPPLSSAPPTIWGSNETSEVAVMEGHLVQFLCEARGVPAPNITWFRDGIPLHPSAEAVYTRGGRQLQLGRARGSDAGLYTCRASNPVGVVEKATRLEVYGEWPGVTTGAVVGGEGHRQGLWAKVASTHLGSSVRGWPEAQDVATEDLAREKGTISSSDFPPAGEGTEARSGRARLGARQSRGENSGFLCDLGLLTKPPDPHDHSQ